MFENAKIGLIGGTTWQSTQIYYETFSRLSTSYSGTSEIMPVVINSINLGLALKTLDEGNHKDFCHIFAKSLNELHNIGCTVNGIACNSFHFAEELILKMTNANFLSILDAVKNEIQNSFTTRVGLLASEYTYHFDFYKKKLIETADIIYPSSYERAKLHKTILKLCASKHSYEDYQFVISVLENLSRAGCEAVILGCTDFAFLLKEYSRGESYNINNIANIFDSTLIHANSIFASALGKESIKQNSNNDKNHFVNEPLFEQVN